MTQKHLEKGIMAVVVAFIVAIVFLTTAHGQGYAPVPVPKMQFFTDSGTPANGYKVCSYSAGTTTPLATYTDSTGGSVNTNPVILDSAGRANIWLGNTSYKLILLTPGTNNTCATGSTIWTVDNVGTYCALSGCNLTGELTVSVTFGTAIFGTTGSSGYQGVLGQSTASSGIGTQGTASGSGGVGIFGLSSDATGIAGKFQNTNASGKLISGLNSSGIEKFSVANTGAITSSSTITGTTLTGTTSLVINGGTAITTTNQTGTGNLVLATGPTVTNASIATGVAPDGSGFKHKRVTTGSILAGATTTVGATNWGTAFADNNYTMTCMVEDVSGANLQIINILSHSASAFSVNVKNNDGGAAHTGTIDCIAVHD